MIVIKLKSKKSQQLIRAKTENITRTQSENKKIAWSRENANVQIAIGFSFSADEFRE